MFSQASCIIPRARALSGPRRAIELTVAITAIAATLVASPVAAATLFEENFEAYAVGSSVTGQGGWVPDYVNSTLNVGNGSFLPSKVLNGLDPANGDENISARPLGFAFDPNRITTFSFDAYATSDGTHNAQIGLGNSSILHFALSGPAWTPYGVPRFGLPGPHWHFDAGAITGVPSNFVDLLGGYDTPVRMSIVVDGVAKEVYGVYDFGSGAQQTPHYAVTDVQIATLNEVGVYFDFRGGRGPELDNLRVFDNVPSVPEPSIAVLMSSALGLIVFVARRRQRNGGA